MHNSQNPCGFLESSIFSDYYDLCGVSNGWNGMMYCTLGYFSLGDSRDQSCVLGTRTVNHSKLPNIDNFHGFRRSAPQAELNHLWGLS